MDQVYDRPDDRDFLNSEIFWGTWSKQEVVLLWSSVPIQNQFIKRNPSTNMACTSYWVGHWVNVMNNLDWDSQYIDCFELWKVFIDKFSKEYKDKYWMNPVTDWAYLQDALKNAKDQGYIIGYGKTFWVVEMEDAISRWQPLFTWTKSIDREATKKDWYAVIGTGYAHAFLIDWYNETHFRCRDSKGEKTLDNGRFRLDKNDIKNLFSVYALIDVKQERTFSKFLEKIEKAKANIRSGQKPVTILEKIAYNNIQR